MNEEGQKCVGGWGWGGDKPPSPLSSDEVNSGVTVRLDAGALIAVDRSSKQCLCAAESGGVSQWVKGPQLHLGHTC